MSFVGKKKELASLDYQSTWVVFANWGFGKDWITIYRLDTSKVSDSFEPMGPNTQGAPAMVPGAPGAPGIGFHNKKKSKLFLRKK